MFILVWFFDFNVVNFVTVCFIIFNIYKLLCFLYALPVVTVLLFLHSSEFRHALYLVIYRFYIILYHRVQRTLPTAFLLLFKISLFHYLFVFHKNKSQILNILLSQKKQRRNIK
jgi:hypothetical protein